jgi:hypothetical protein
VLLGLPVLTADYDSWLAIEDIEAFNEIGLAFELQPMQSPAEAPATVALPSIDDLILTKQFGARPRDLEDIRLLTILKEQQ